MASTVATAILLLLLALSIIGGVLVWRAVRRGPVAEREAARRVETELDAARAKDERDLLDLQLDALAEEWDRVEDR